MKTAGQTAQRLSSNGVPNDGTERIDTPHQDPNDTEADEKPSGIAEAEHAPAASVVNRALRKGASAASALGERVSKTASAVTPLASEVRKTAEAAEKATRNIARTAERTSLGIADRLTTVLVLCIQALWGA